LNPNFSLFFENQNLNFIIEKIFKGDHECILTTVLFKKLASKAELISEKIREKVRLIKFNYIEVFLNLTFFFENNFSMNWWRK
jgi:hypothetical protein